MSYWIYLEDNKGAVNVPTHHEGATVTLGGDDLAGLNVTYNYSKHFKFRDLHCRRGEETIKMLEDAVQRLGTQRDSDYWAATPGNAGHACSILLAWAKEHPEAVWRVS